MPPYRVDNLCPTRCLHRSRGRAAARRHQRVCPAAACPSRGAVLRGAAARAARGPRAHLGSAGRPRRLRLGARADVERRHAGGHAALPHGGGWAGQGATAAPAPRAARGQLLRSNYMDDGVRRPTRAEPRLFRPLLVDKQRGRGKADGPAELLFMSALGTSLSYQASLSRSTVSLLVRHLQIDNQLRDAVVPVLLRPSWSDAETRNHEAARAAGQRSNLPASLEVLVQRNTSAPGIAYYDTVSLRLQTLELMIDYQARPASPRTQPTRHARDTGLLALRGTLQRTTRRTAPRRIPRARPRHPTLRRAPAPGALDAAALRHALYAHGAVITARPPAPAGGSLGPRDAAARAEGVRAGSTSSRCACCSGRSAGGNGFEVVYGDHARRGGHGRAQPGVGHAGQHRPRVGPPRRSCSTTSSRR